MTDLKKITILRKTIVTLFLFALSLLCGCQKNDIEYISSIITEESTESDGLNTEGTPLLTDELLISEQDKLYDITSVLPSNINGTLVTYGLLSPKKLCLIYQNRKVGGKCELFVKSLNLETGEVADIYDTWTCNVDGNGEIPYIGMLSASPLILADYTNNKIYRPQNYGHVVTDIPFEHLGAGFCAYEDDIYSVESNGLICRITEAGEFEPVFHIPDSYNNLWVDKSDDSHFIMVNASTYLGDMVSLYIDPKTKKCITYKKEDSSFYVSGTWKDKIYGLEIADSGQLVLLCDESAGERLELEIHSEQNPEDTYMELHEGAVCGQAMLLGFIGTDSKIQKLYYWDSSEAETKVWDRTEKAGYLLPPVEDDELKVMADEIEEKYGIQVAYGENVVTSVTDYTFEKCTNKGKIMAALTMLDETFAIYPEGMFNKIENGFEEIVVYLTGAQAPINDMEGVLNTQGLTTQENGFIMVLLDIDTVDLGRAIIVHEMTHVIDRKLTVDGVLDEDTWASMNPEDFTYHYRYVSENGTQYSGNLDNRYTSYYDGAYEDGFSDTYFYDEYAMTWPTEDRARMMENLIGYVDYIEPCFASGHMQEKLMYYFEIIRSDLGDENWPEKTEWELKLDSYIEN